MLNYIIETLFGFLSGVLLGITGIPGTAIVLLGLDYFKIKILSPIRNMRLTIMTNKLITIKKAAEMLSVSNETLRNWEKDDKIIPVYTAG